MTRITQTSKLSWMISARIGTFVLLTLCVAWSRAEDQTNSDLKPVEAPADAAKSEAKPKEFSEYFRTGVEKYQAKKFAEAADEFFHAAKLDPENTSVLTDWGLAEYQAGHIFKSVALFRRTLHLDPDFLPAEQALDFIFPSLAVKDIPHQISWMENFHTHWLAPLPLSSGLIAALFCLASGGWLMIVYWSRRKKALRDDLALPNTPVIGILISALFLLSSFWSVSKALDLRTERATVIEEKIPVMSAPDAKSVSLFDLYGGLQVVVDGRVSGDWVFINYPGALSGWVSKNSLMRESGPL